MMIFRIYIIRLAIIVSKIASVPACHGRRRLFPNAYCQIAHGAAAFLPWHRYLLHIYERTLRDQCGFSGSLT